MLSPEQKRLHLAAHLSRADALSVFRRKVPQANASAAESYYPFWWISLQLRVVKLLGRRAGQDAQPAQPMQVLVNAVSGAAFIADFTPRGTSLDIAHWQEMLAGTVPQVSAAQATAAARTLVRTRALKTVKLGMRLEISELCAPIAVLKTNWLVNGENSKHAATILVDGFDSSHYVLRVSRI